MLISTEATSFSQIISDEEWLFIASLLQKQGYDVVFNTKNEKFKLHKTVFLSIKETVEFLCLSGYFIGYRSGLCDVLLPLTNARALVVYPNYVKSPITIKNYYSIEKIYNRSNIKEAIYLNKNHLAELAIKSFHKRASCKKFY